MCPTSMGSEEMHDTVSTRLVLAASMFWLCAAQPGQALAEASERKAYFGDLHVHTRYSADAYSFGARAGPDEAYAFARGAPLRHPSGQIIRMRGAPLDFLAVTDHAEYLGNVTALGNPDHPLSGSELTDVTDGVMMAAFLTFGSALRTGEVNPDLHDDGIRRDAWQRIVAAAERNNEPGRFTAFVGYEYTSSRDGMLHRNVVFEGARVPELPFGATDSRNPEDLWAWLDRLRGEGIEALAIAHNTNLSNGQYFETTTFDDEPLDADYAEARMRNEPIVEMTQVKGTSETHPMLSPNDEWADFEVIGGGVPGAYVRDALLTGLEMGDAQGFNPYRFGFIGASDTHNVGGAYEEPAYHGKIGNADGRPEWRRITPLETVPEAAEAAAEPSLLDLLRTGPITGWGASGLAGVWAEGNTREALYAAFRRRETFATSGPRIRVKFFAGYGPDAPDGPALEAGGVPMGGELEARAGSGPRFLARALRDPQSAWLQRLQIVKGWLDDGVRRERVFDVACSDGLSPDPETHRCPGNGAGVDLATCAFDHDKGAVELRSVWSDPDFDASQRAFYYVRALEDPTCRWSTWEALRMGLPIQAEVPATLQERAWSSPIWITPI